MPKGSVASKQTAESQTPCGRALPPKLESDSNKTALWDSKLSDYLFKQNLNQSEARNKILDTLKSQSGHFTSQQLVKLVQNTHPSVGAATVYRNIPILVGAGILKESLSDLDGQTFFEVSDDHHHDHIVCLDCNHIFEFHNDDIEQAQIKSARAMHFEQISHRHVIFAKCDLGRATKPRNKD